MRRVKSRILPLFLGMCLLVLLGGALSSVLHGLDLSHSHTSAHDCAFCSAGAIFSTGTETSDIEEPQPILQLLARTIIPSFVAENYSTGEYSYPSSRAPPSVVAPA